MISKSQYEKTPSSNWSRKKGSLTENLGLWAQIQFLRASGFCKKTNTSVSSSSSVIPCFANPFGLSDVVPTSAQ